MKYVYVLEADLNGPSFDPNDIGGDYDGITRVHATLRGAIASLDAWLDSNGIDRSIAHGGEMKCDGFVGNDVDPDLLDGDVLRWGINKMDVEA